MKYIFSVLFVVSLLSMSCHFLHGERIKGDGNITKQDRPVSDFNRVDVSGAIDVFVTQDSAFSVKVETDGNLQEFIEVYKEGEVLRIRPRENTNPDPSRSIKVYVAAPVYKELEAAGASSINGTGKITGDAGLEINVTGASKADLTIKAPEVNVEATGASSITIKGETKDLSGKGSGSSTLLCLDLLAENADIEVSGASSADVYASVKLDAKASGASHVKYKGNANVSRSESGASSVTKME